MKSTIHCKKETDTINYPCLMKGPLSGVIVLMVACGRGTVVSGKSDHGLKVGDYGDNWTCDMLPFNGTVTLEN